MCVDQEHSFDVGLFGYYAVIVAPVTDMIFQAVQPVRMYIKLKMQLCSFIK